MRYTLKQAIDLVGVSKTCVLRWISSGLVKPKRVEAAYFSAGFIYEFAEKDISKMRTMKRGRGRPGCGPKDAAP